MDEEPNFVKTELLLVSGKTQHLITTSPFSIGSSTITPPRIATNFGVAIDDQFNFTEHPQRCMLSQWNWVFMSFNQQFNFQDRLS